MKDKVSVLTLLLCYFIPARIIFDYVYKSSPIVIDEVFHLPIGLKYCERNFTEWDNKITTLPGLYFFSSILTFPFGICTVYALRYTVFFTSLINLVLIYFLRKHWVPNETITIRMFNVYNIATIPPVLFFSMVYYTDILSMMLVNAMILCGLKGRSFIASIFGFLAVLTRQNNAVYILFIAGYKVLGHIYYIITNDKVKARKGKWDSRMLKIKLRSFFKKNLQDHDFTNLIIDGLCYSVPLISLAIFFYLNGGVVVGDKSAHSATIHIPQLFYFSIFTMFFIWPHASCYMLPFFKFLYQRFLLSLVCFTLIILVVHYNTIIHPYMLADNRHYLFYIWRYFLAAPIQRLVACPIYLCTLFCLTQLCNRAAELRFSLNCVYALMLLSILTTQALIDVRYFLTPYVILRTFILPTTKIDLVLELWFQSAVSAYTLYMFGNKEIYWDDFDYAQRLIW